MSPGAESLVGWTPIRVHWQDPGPLLEWCYTAGVPFGDPFFDQTVERCFRDPFRLLFRRCTDMQELARFVATHPGLPPAGFIFHMSRCGSTAVAQMLASSPEHLVLSEAAPIDAVLRATQAAPDINDDRRVAWLRWMVAALGQPRHASQRRLFVKFDAWSAAELGLVRRAFPSVPWLFLFRDPVEVLVSQVARPGAHVIPGVLPPDALGMDWPTLRGCSQVEYAARALARICEAALEAGDDSVATFADYRRLPELVTSDLAASWSLSLDADDVRRMHDVAGRNAKNPAIPFEDDSAAKQARAGPELRQVAEHLLAPVHRRVREVERRQLQRGTTTVAS